ncbi:phage/plasmid primase, P4 family [Mucilaginibacter sp.]|uniref:DNA primase family protein n=1 Tax=Mucilaginibacter sp. TaxID=1882438 RepID=UPI00374D7B48
MRPALLNVIINDIAIIDFISVANLRRNERPMRKHYVVIVIDELLQLCNNHGFGLCTKDGFCYVFNGAYWQLLDKDELKSFLGEVALLMGVNSVDAKHHQFREELLAQCFSSANFQPNTKPSGTTLINLRNGTFEIESVKQSLRDFNKNDFLTYQLSFDFDPNAQAPMFKEFLDKVLPDIQAQEILAEYLGYVFIEHSSLKLEKALMLYGSGANGKSVIFEIVSALLGNENISNYSLEKITSDNYSRAMLSGKLLNYASEISNRLNPAVFKQLVSGEPVEARLPYGKPFTLANYAKLLFNCNELPKDVEHTDAFYRRLLIVPFLVTIPVEAQDPLLANKIIASELAGVFNWILAGLKRLICTGQFTVSISVTEVLNQYRMDSNPVQLYLDDMGYIVSIDEKAKQDLRDLYYGYRKYCEDYGYKPLSYVNFKKRLQNSGIKIISAHRNLYACIERGKQLNPPNAINVARVEIAPPSTEELKGYCGLF